MSLARKLFDFTRAVVRRAAHIEMVGGLATYNQDGLLSKHNADFQVVPRFAAAYAKGTETGSWGREQIQWRAHVVTWAAQNGMRLEGDFVECGAYTGAGIKTVMDYLGGPELPKVFWGYDLFEHDASMAHHAMPEHGPQLEARVRQKFAAYPQVRIVKGAIPGAFEGQSPAKIAYLHIDLNEAPAEVASLEALFDRVTPGGLVVLDDYEWASHRAQKLAEDAWFEARQYRVFPLPTGQGIVIKR